MGMYTEVYICSKLTKDVPMDILKYLFTDNFKLPIPEDLKLPDHPFFKVERWFQIGHCCSYYHIPYPTSDLRFDETSKNWYLVSRSDIKNYDNQIELFFDWVMPYLDKCEGEFIGYSRYEEFDEPKLYFKKGTYDSLGFKT